LDDELMKGLLERYGVAVSCVAFMGGDGEPAEVNRLAALVKAAGLKTAWYSGCETLSPAVQLSNLDFAKIGPYDPEHGGLDNPCTNQRFYRVEEDEGSGTHKLVDATPLFRKNH
jgi:anaerobic ribonucleoside-triphosphate reductase activating protein